MKYFLFALVGLLFSSCFEFKDLEFKGIDNAQLPRFENKELLIDVTVRINNVNPYKIKIKPSELQVYIDDNFVGTVFLDNKVVLKRKSENSYSAQLRGKMADGVLFTLMRVALKEEVTLQLKGKVKGTIYGFSRKIDVDQKRVVNTAKIKEMLKLML
jgi:LEA14-like dessication related protein